MDSIALKPTSALGGVARKFDGIDLQEWTGLAVVSAAIPLNGTPGFTEAVHAAYGAELPGVGRTTQSADGRIRLLGLQPGLIFLLFEETGPNAVNIVADALGDVGYYTDQSDSWVAVHLYGGKTRRALQFLCPLDLHPDVFPPDAVARTTMEHLGVIIIADGEEGFLLLSPRSSAPSVLHALEAAILQAAAP